MKTTEYINNILLKYGFKITASYPIYTEYKNKKKTGYIYEYNKKTIYVFIYNKNNICRAIHISNNKFYEMKTRIALLNDDVDKFDETFLVTQMLLL